MSLLTDIADALESEEETNEVTLTLEGPPDGMKTIEDLRYVHNQLACALSLIEAKLRSVGKKPKNTDFLLDKKDNYFHPDGKEIKVSANRVEDLLIKLGIDRHE